MALDFLGKYVIMLEITAEAVFWGIAYEIIGVAFDWRKTGKKFS